MPNDTSIKINYSIDLSDIDTYEILKSKINRVIDQIINETEAESNIKTKITNELLEIGCIINLMR